MPRTFVIVALLLAGMVLPAAGQTGRVKFTSLGTRDGLVSNSINAILKDRYGWMWFATNDGLNRFDGSNFTAYRRRAGDSNTLRANEVLALHEDKAGQLWVGTSGGALSRYDRNKDVFVNYPLTGHPGPLSPNALVRDICSDSSGKIWIAQYEAPYVLDPVTGKIDKLDLQRFASGTSEKITLYCLFKDHLDRMWVGTDKGLFLFQSATQTFRQFRHMPGDTTTLVDDNVTAMAEDQTGNIWVGTQAGLCRMKAGESGFAPVLPKAVVNAIAVDKDGLMWVGTSGGLQVFNPDGHRLAVYLPDETDQHSLTSKGIRSVFIDKEGIYWIGTFRAGVNKYDKNLNLFDGKLSNAFRESGTGTTVVTAFEERPDGNLWLGTDGGGLFEFNRGTGKLLPVPIRLKSGPDSPLTVLALKKTKDDLLYLGTWGNGVLIRNTHTGAIRQLVKEPGPGGLSGNDIYCLSEDRTGDIWVGTNGSGVNVLRNGKVVCRMVAHPSAPGDIRFPINPYIRAIREDTSGNIWIGTHGGGIAVYDRNKGSFKIYDQDEGALPSNKIQSMLLDRKGRLWIGTYGGGLVLYDQKKDRFVVYAEKDGLQNANVYQVVEDPAGLIWVTTNTGISSFDPDSARCRNFTRYNGVQNNNFVHQSGICTSDGELFFGGQQGFNYFYPTTLTTNRNVPVVVLSDLKVANRSVIPGPGAPIREQIAAADEIRLNYKQNFALTFVALNYTLPNQNQYAYKLEGFDKDWIYSGGLNTAYYTNLDPGDYVFRVKASNNDGVWSTTDRSIRIHIQPPFWRTPYAYAFYIAMVGLILLYSRHRGVTRLRRKFALEQEQQEAKRAQELEQLKLKFLTNLSHEFRTPISLIMGPVDQLIASQEDGVVDDKLQLIKRNSRRLLNLVNQLLDFRKMEEQELRLQLSEGEIVGFIRDVCQSFSDLSERKNIRFIVESRIPRLYAWFDKDKIERILFNLLSNAFKFTPEGGSITLVLADCGPAGDRRQTVSVSITDTGIGIPAEKKRLIFERFFQHAGPGSILNQGSGIGLSITKEFVTLHGGTIEVESELERGSTFTILLPLTLAEPGRIGDESSLPPAPQRKEEPAAGLDGKPVLLLVEDNEDFRFYLKDNLRLHYTVIEATNGREGWQKALAGHPDLIVSDVSMPYEDGITLTRRLKADKRTAHIPVILLTALAEQGHQLAGLETGANDYITKPFDFELLHAKIRNLLELRHTLKTTFSRQIGIAPATTEVANETADEKLLRKIVACIEANLDDPQLSVGFLSRELGMSRTTLYNKLLELTGQKPVEYIRNFKLEKAVLLLQHNEFTIAEVAYRVGFSTPNYFARAFKGRYKLLPSEYASQFRKPSENNSF